MSAGPLKEPPFEDVMLLSFFTYSHLPPPLQSVSQPFFELAQKVATTTPENPERTMALRKLLEAKDCAVRAVLVRR